MKEKVKLIYQKLLRKTHTYNYYLSWLDGALTKEELQQLKKRLYNDILTEFYFLSSIPEDTLSLAYEDCLQNLEQNNVSKKH